jgi:hypothetical protein
MRVPLVLAAALAVLAPASAQPPTLPVGPPTLPPAKSPEVPKSESPKVPREPEFDVAFVDGSNIKLVVLETAFAVTTKYGKLTVPLDDLKRVELGFRYPDGVEAKLDAAVEKLGSPVFADREAAGAEILALKDYAGPTLKRATQDADAERQRRATTLLAAVRRDVPAERVDAKDFDTVETPEFTVRGRLEATTFKARTRQFGDAVVRLAEVKQFRSLGVAVAAGEITLDASKYGKLDWSAWLDTGLDISADAPLSITCTGTIDQWPQEAGKYMSGPAGNGTPAPNQRQPVRVLPQGAVGPVPGQPFMPNRPGMNVAPASGAVIGRIGPASQPFLVGASLQVPRAPAAGRLYLQIAPSHWNNDNLSGSYKVRVKTTAE